MATTVVPLNTMLADLDESLRTMLKRDLDRHGFDGVEIVFDAPSKEWSATLSSPTVDCFLYDLREAVDRRPIDWYQDGGNGRREIRPPMRLDASYAVTAWTRVRFKKPSLVIFTRALIGTCCLFRRSMTGRT